MFLDNGKYGFLIFTSKNHFLPFFRKSKLELHFLWLSYLRPFAAIPRKVIVYETFYCFGAYRGDT